MAQTMDIDAAGAAAITAELSKQASRAPTDNIANDRRISDRRDLAQLNRFLTAVNDAVHGLYWTPILEQWLLRQFDADNESGVLYRSLVDSLTPVHREVAPGINVATYFASFSDFRSKFIKKLHGCATFHSLVHKHVKHLKIAPGNPSMARNAVDLASKIVRAFDLLNPNDRPNESAMAGLILSQLPEQTNARVEAASMVAREELTTLEVLRRHLEAVDAEFSAISVASKRRNPSVDNFNAPNKYIRPGAGPFQEYDSTPSLPGPPRSQPSFPRSGASNIKGLAGYGRYNGICSGCGKSGHSIMLCDKVSHAEKKAWQRKVALTKTSKGMQALNLNDQ